MSGPAMPAGPDLGPGVEAAVRANFARMGLMGHLGAALSRIAPGEADVRVPFRPELAQQHGYFHGGVMGAIADTACGCAALTLVPPGDDVLTVEYKINITAPGDGDVLVARGAVRRAGRTLIVTHGDVFVEKAGVETLCAAMLQTIMALPAGAGRPARRPSRGRRDA